MMSQRQLGQADSGAQRLSSRIEHAPLVDESGRKYRLAFAPMRGKALGSPAPKAAPSPAAAPGRCAGCWFAAGLVRGGLARRRG